MPSVATPAFPDEAGPVVLVDAGHHERHTLDGSFAPFGRLLAADGYRLRAHDGPITAEALECADVLVIANALHGSDVGNWERPIEPAFAEAEVEAIVGWVEDGGALLLIADHMPFAGAVAPLAARLGIEWVDGFALHPEGRGIHTFTRAAGGIAPNPATDAGPGGRADSVTSFTGSAFRAPEADPVLILPPDWLVLEPEVAWEFDEATPATSADGFLQGATLELGKGRVAAFGEAAMFTAQVAGPGRAPVGLNHPAAVGNEGLVRNVIAWLATGT